MQGFADFWGDSELSTFGVDNFVDTVENLKKVIHSLWILWITLWISRDTPVDIGG